MNNMRKVFYPVFLIICILSCSPSKQSFPSDINPFQYSINKKVIAKKAAVVSAHPLASKIGVQIMKDGGNAFDAAIATQLALAVVYPGAGNLGGGGFMVARLAGGETVALDFREKAPS